MKSPNSEVKAQYNNTKNIPTIIGKIIVATSPTPIFSKRSMSFSFIFLLF